MSAIFTNNRSSAEVLEAHYDLPLDCISLLRAFLFPSTFTELGLRKLLISPYCTAVTRFKRKSIHWNPFSHQPFFSQIGSDVNTVFIGKEQGHAWAMLSSFNEQRSLLFMLSCSQGKKKNPSNSLVKLSLMTLSSSSLLFLLWFMSKCMFSHYQFLLTHISAN